MNIYTCVLPQNLDEIEFNQYINNYFDDYLGLMVYGLILSLYFTKKITKEKKCLLDLVIKQYFFEHNPPISVTQSISLTNTLVTVFNNSYITIIYFQWLQGATSAILLMDVENNNSSIDILLENNYTNNQILETSISDSNIVSIDIPNNGAQSLRLSVKKVSGAFNPNIYSMIIQYL